MTGCAVHAASSVARGERWWRSPGHGVCGPGAFGRCGFLLGILALLAVPPLASAQGQVGFFNTSTTLISTNSAPGDAATGPTSALVGDYYFALFAASPGT